MCSGRPSAFRHKGTEYNILKRIRLRRGVEYWVVEQWPKHAQTPRLYKAFDSQITYTWVSIRVRNKGDVSRERLTKLRDLVQVAKQSSPNLPRVVDRGQDKENEYLVTEWIDGYTLKHYIDQGKKAKPYFVAAESYRLIVGLVKGLLRLHKGNIIHGDLKPENIVVAGPPARLIPIDFGTAWFGTRARERSREATPGYASPEQWANARLVDHRTDQFAASVILYQMLTGELPYEGLGGRVIEDPNPPPLELPSQKNSQVWSALDRVIAQGLALDRNDRFETTSAWLDALVLAAPSEDTVGQLRDQAQSLLRSVRHFLGRSKHE